MRNALVLLLSATCCFGAGTARADEATKKAALELQRLVLPKENYQKMLDQTEEQLLLSMQQSGAPPATPETVEKMKKMMAEVLPYDELMQWSAEVYAERFTLGEINDLKTFYSTPTGKKAARVLPDLMGEVGKKMGPILMQRLPVAMQKYGLVPPAPGGAPSESAQEPPQKEAPPAAPAAKSKKKK
jgi:hypothetical protein